MIKQSILLLAFLTLCVILCATDFSSNPSELGNSAMRNMSLHNEAKLEGLSCVEEENNYSDDFNLPYLRKHWINIGNQKKWTLHERPGFLRMKAASKSIQIEESISQVIEHKGTGEAICYFDLTNLQEKAEAGIFLSQGKLNSIGIKKNRGLLQVSSQTNGKSSTHKIESNWLILKLSFDSDEASFEFSFDGIQFISIGEKVNLKTNLKNINCVGLYCINNGNNASSVDVDWFYFKQKRNSKAQFADNIF